MPRKAYTPQFKEQAVRLASVPGEVVEHEADVIAIATCTFVDG